MRRERSDADAASNVTARLFYCPELRFDLARV
jgi:hypothetical protein